MKTLSLIITTLLSLQNWACIGEQFDETVHKSSVQPLVVSLAVDQSRSTVINEIPQVTSQTLDTIFAIMRNRGGELAFSGINERKPQLIRIKFVPERGKPEEVTNARIQNDQALASVRENMYHSVSNRSAPRTRLYDTLELLSLFMREPHHQRNVKKILITVSDFCEDVRPLNQREPLALPNDVTALSLGGHPDLVAQVLAGRVYNYTTISGIIEFLNMEEAAQ